MNLAIKGHHMTRKVKTIQFQPPDFFLIAFETHEPYALEYIEFHMSELLSIDTIEKNLDALMEKFK